MELATLFGIILGIGGIAVGNYFDGGDIASLGQFAALVIVLCGTWGATLVANSAGDVRSAFKMFWRAFKKSGDSGDELVHEILEYARLAKRETLLALEPRLPHIAHPFLRSVLRSVVDGVDPVVLADVYRKRINYEEEKTYASSQVWMDAGGYSPTIGIIGAVLGLIHVMGNLTDTSRLGAGIATAFVATIYGVGFANLIYLPIGTKLRKVIQYDTRIHEMILEGGLSIQQGMTPSLIEIKLNSFLKNEDKDWRD